MNAAWMHAVACDSSAFFSEQIACDHSPGSVQSVTDILEEAKLAPGNAGTIDLKLKQLKHTPGVGSGMNTGISSRDVSGFAADDDGESTIVTLQVTRPTQLVTRAVTTACLSAVLSLESPLLVIVIGRIILI